LTVYNSALILRWIRGKWRIDFELLSFMESLIIKKGGAVVHAVTGT
jgi:hypothetical protein